MRKLDLQRAFLGPRALAEDLEDQPRAVQHLGVQLFFEIALLHRRQRMVDDDHLSVPLFDDLGELRDLAAAEQGRRAWIVDGHHRRMDQIEVDGARKADRFVMAGLGRTRQPWTVRVVVIALVAGKDGHNDNGPGRALGFRPGMMRWFSANCSVRVFLTCQSGALAVLAIEHLNRLARHDRGNGVLVDELRMTVTPQQNTEIVERSDHARQLDAVDEKDGEWIFALAN
jgi:hypothetical protein